MNERGNSGRTLPWLSTVDPSNSSEINVKVTSSVPKTCLRIWNKAPPNVACPDGYDGNGGVKGIPLDIEHFLHRAKETNDWQEETISKEQIIMLLQTKIENVSIKNVKEDVVRFIKDDKVLDIWSPSYFNQLIEKMKFKEIN